jgi:hypothetical protein
MQSLMSIHDVEDKSVVNYPHHEWTFITKRFHEEKKQGSADIMNVEC